MFGVVNDPFLLIPLDNILETEVDKLKTENRGHGVGSDHNKSEYTTPLLCTYNDLIYWHMRVQRAMVSRAGSSILSQGIFVSSQVGWARFLSLRDLLLVPTWSEDIVGTKSRSLKDKTTRPPYSSN